MTWRQSVHGACVAIDVALIVAFPHSNAVPLFAGCALFSALAFLAESRKGSSSCSR